MRWRDPIEHILTLFKKLDHFVIEEYISIGFEWPSLQRESVDLLQYFFIGLAPGLKISINTTFCVVQISALRHSA
jgi:hypothetical protein